VRKFLIALLATLLALGMMGGVFAYFTDTETSSNNSATACTMNLKVSDNDEFPPQDGVEITWSMTGMEPGVTTCPIGSVDLYNDGPMEADHVEISFTHEIDDLPDVDSDTNKSSLPADMAEWIEIVTMGYNGGDDFVGLYNSDPTTYDSNGNGFFDLEDVTLAPWTDEHGPFDDLPAPPANSTGFKSFHLNLEFNAGATDDIQGDTLTTTVHFTLNQDASQ
jgi:predicted ribosomally synthesized peptide with SipW-like signal peptide